MFANAGLFLIQTLLDLYIYIVILRFLLQTVHADFFNPLSQFAIKFTQWIVKPLQRIIPEVKHVDLAIILLLFVLEIIKFTLIGLVSPKFPHIAGLLLFSFADLINQFLMFYFYIIIIRAILTWIMPSHHNPTFFALSKITDPILRPIRRILPMIGGFDLSPIVAIILTQFLALLIVSPLQYLALQLS